MQGCDTTSSYSLNACNIFIEEKTPHSFWTFELFHPSQVSVE